MFSQALHTDPHTDPNRPQSPPVMTIAPVRLPEQLSIAVAPGSVKVAWHCTVIGSAPSSEMTGGVVSPTFGAHRSRGMTAHIGCAIGDRGTAQGTRGHRAGGGLSPPIATINRPPMVIASRKNSSRLRAAIINSSAACAPQTVLWQKATLF